VAVVQYTFTHKQYIEQHNRHKQTQSTQTIFALYLNSECDVANCWKKTVQL